MPLKCGLGDHSLYEFMYDLCIAEIYIEITFLIVA